ncbi:MAG: TIGR03000 domain-containing protein, partial [Gemmataceae bacterium]|nr:TIGR03000 domain-containing protein [Gemmataceae bacterium]
RIDVNVPSNSLLTVEGKTWPTGQRSIVTPDLKRGETYVYTLKLERDSNGRKETLTRDVSFKAGEVVAVDFDAPRSLAAR